MHKEHEKIAADKESGWRPLLFLALGIAFVFSALIFLGLIISKSEFFGIERYYEDYSMSMYVVSILFFLLGLFVFSRIKLKSIGKRDPDYIIR